MGLDPDADIKRMRDLNQREGNYARLVPPTTESLTSSPHSQMFKVYSHFLLSAPSHCCESEVALRLTAVGMVVGQPEGAGAGAGARETPPWRNDKTEVCSRQSAVGRLFFS